MGGEWLAGGRRWSVGQRWLAPGVPYVCMHDREHAWRKGWGWLCNVGGREVTCGGAAASLLFPLWRLVSRSSRLMKDSSQGALTLSSRVVGHLLCAWRRGDVTDTHGCRWSWAITVFVLCVRTDCVRGGDCTAPHSTHHSRLVERVCARCRDAMLRTCMARPSDTDSLSPRRGSWAAWARP